MENEKLGGYTREALKELCEKATPGPWTLDPHYQIYVWGPKSEMIADDGQDEEGTLTRMRGVGANLPLKDNGDFIAAARTALPACLQRIEELEKQNGQLLEWANKFENDEASVCPEDVGFVEYIKILSKQRDELKCTLDAIAEALGQPKECPRSACPGKLMCDAEYCPLVSIRPPEYQPDQLPGMVRELRADLAQAQYAMEQDAGELAALRGALKAFKDDYGQDGCYCTSIIGTGKCALCMADEALASRTSGDGAPDQNSGDWKEPRD